jgi:hypothetical protein
MVRKTLYGAAIAILSLSTIQSAVAEPTIDNSALESTAFRPHERTFGLVYTMPPEVNETLHRSLGGCSMSAC